MSDLPPLPPRNDLPLALTRAHLFALGALSLALSILTFFIGMQLGRGHKPDPGAPAAAPLIREEIRSGDLEALLTRVERAQGDAPLTFPADLPRSELPATSDGVPTTGFALMVASAATAEEAQHLVETLRAGGLAAYRVAALRDGHPTHLVKVGGFAAEEAALAALPDVRTRSGAEEVVVTPVP